MLKWFQNLFPKKLPPNHLRISEVQTWLDGQVSHLSFRLYLPSYYSEISSIKEQLSQNLKLLQEKPLSAKDKEQVSGRVQNIVLGHRDSYVREIRLFVEQLHPLQKENFSTLRDFQDAIHFNDQLNLHLEQMAVKTEKSYHTAQHLFFEQIETIFKLLGQLNTLVGNFRYKVREVPLNKIEQCYRLILSLEQSLKQDQNWGKDLVVKEELLATVQKDLNLKEQALKTLMESPEQKQFQELQRQKLDAGKEIAKVEDEIFTFFAKLTKALRKYEHIAPDPKPLQKYLENSVDALLYDSKLEIISIFTVVKQNLQDGSILFDDKQRDIFVEMIAKAEQGYLKDLQSRGLLAQERQTSLQQKVDSAVITASIQKAERERVETQNTVSTLLAEKEKLQLRIQELNAEKQWTELQQRIQEAFNQEMVIQS